MKNKYLLAPALVIFLSACSSEKTVEKIVPAEPQAETSRQEEPASAFTGQINSTNVRVRFLENEEPGYYTLVISWHKDVPSLKLSLYGGDFRTISDTNSFSMIVKHSTKHEIVMIAQDVDGNDVSTYNLTAHAPEDKIFTNTTNLTETTFLTVNRIYLLEGARIVTHGHDLSLRAKKIYVHPPTFDSTSWSYAQILTTVPTTKAKNIMELYQSNIDVVADEAYGYLLVGMVGFNGIDGQNGKDGAHGAKGENGIDGSVKSVNEPCISLHGRPCRQAPKIECSQNPANGKNGLPGQPGGDGEAGSDGGRTGTLRVFVNKKADFKLVVAHKRSQGGLGGAGGKGGLGGSGGKAGANPHNKCVAAKDGAQGPNGIDGKTGTPGNPGKLGEVSTNVQDFTQHEE